MTVMNFIRKKLGLKLVYKNPKFISKYCKGNGVEIGGSSHQVFKVNALNVDKSDHLNDDVYSKQQKELAGYVKKVDIIANGDNLPLEDNSLDFVFSSHVIEHFYDPVSAINEWLRVTKKNGHVVMVIPNKKRTFDCEKECTTLDEFEARHAVYDKNLNYPDKHHSIWTLESFIDFANNYNYCIEYCEDELPSAKNSFGVVIKKV